MKHCFYINKTILQNQNIFIQHFILLSLILNTMATQKITLGAGCFWCVETAFRRLKGVQSAISGYTGGHTVNPTYEAVNFLFFIIYVKIPWTKK